MRKLHILVNNSLTTTTGNVLELQFLDLIFDSFDWNTWTELRLVQDVVNKVQASKPSLIRLLIDSEGGACNIGIAIYNFLKKYAADNGIEIEVDILAMAGSIASVLAMSATPGKLRIPANAFMVIHKAWGWGEGNAEDLRQQADVIDGYTATIVDIYSNRTGKSADEINALIAPGDYWMDGRKCVELGFADELSNDASFSIAARINGINAHYRNIPQAVIAAAEEEVTENGLPDKPNFLTNIKNEVMDLKKIVTNFIAAMAGKKVNPAAENLAEEVVNTMSEPLNAMMSAMQDEVTNELATMKTTITNDLTASLTQTITDAVTASFTAQINTLTEANNSLIQEIADLKGEERDPKNVPNNKGNFGFFGNVTSAKAE